MFRVDAQHSFAPPHQGPGWYGKILDRNRFSGSVYVAEDGSIEEALELAAQYPYIQRVVPKVSPNQLDEVPGHPKIVSIYLTQPAPDAVAELQRRGLALETSATHWPFAAGVPVALDGMPLQTEFPPLVFVKLTGFRLPVSLAQSERLRQLLRHPGPERLMFASGWPHAGGTWKETLAAFTQSLGAMPIALREQLLGGTARNFYGLSLG